MKKYIGLFTGAYIISHLLLIVIGVLLHLKASAGFGFVAVSCGSYLAAWKFNHDKGREPTLDEKKNFSWQSTLAVVGVTLLFYIGMAFMFFSVNDVESAINQLGLAMLVSILIGAVLFISIVYYMTIRLTFAWFAKMMGKSKTVL